MRNNIAFCPCVFGWFDFFLFVPSEERFFISFTNFFLIYLFFWESGVVINTLLISIGSNELFRAFEIYNYKTTREILCLCGQIKYICAKILKHREILISNMLNCKTQKKNFTSNL